MLMRLMAAAAVTLALAAPVRAQAADDNLQLFRSVQKQVLQYPHFTIFDSVHAQFDEGVVTLSGKVTMPYKRNDLEKRVAKVDGNRAWLNIGSSSGVKVGDKFTLFNMGDAIVDPDTGQSLGASEKETGAGAVTEVQDRFAVITFTGSAKVKDTARKKQ